MLVYQRLHLAPLHLVVLMHHDVFFAVSPWHLSFGMILIFRSWDGLKPPNRFGVRICDEHL